MSDENTPVHVITLVDKGYARTQPMNSYTRIEGRKYALGFAKDSRVEFGGPIVPGWSGWINATATVIAAYQIPEAVTDVNVGDFVQGPEGSLWRIVRDQRPLRGDNIFTLEKVFG